MTPSTVAQKARRGYPLDILVRTGALRDSLQGKTGDTIEDIRPLSLHLGTTVPYGIYHQKGSPGRLPRRAPIELNEQQKKDWTKAIHVHLLRAAREQGLA